MTNPCLTITDSYQCYAYPVKMDIMKCLLSKGHYCSISRDLYPIQGNTDCALALYFDDDNVTKSHSSIIGNTISKNSRTQLRSNHYLIAVMKPRSTACRCPGYTDTKTINPPLAVITKTNGYSIFTPDFMFQL